MAVWIWMIFTSSSFFHDLSFPTHLFCNTIMIILSMKLLRISISEILENLFHRLCKFCYQLLFFDSWWQSNMISNFFTMLYLYFAVAAQPAVWRWNNSVSSLKLISGTVLFSDQWSFFLFTFISTVEMDPMEQIKKQNECFELIR